MEPPRAMCAEDHLLLAMRLFIAMDMPLWLTQVVGSLSELGRRLIVASEQRGLFEYLSRTLAPDAPIRVVLGDEPSLLGGQLERAERTQRQHIEAMLRSHGFSIAE